MEGRRRCVFVDDWVCHVEVDEIPLEVCRTCLDARRLRIEQGDKVVRQAVGAAEPLRPGADSRAVMGALSMLDRQFLEGGIGLEEYIQRRKALLESIAR